MTNPTELQARLRKRFEVIAAERISKMTHAWSLVESTNSVDARREFSRELHTLKGESRMVGCPLAGDVAHLLEDAFGAVERKELNPDVLTETIIEGFDWVQRLVVHEGDEPPEGLIAFQERLRHAIQKSESQQATATENTVQVESATVATRLRGLEDVRVSWEKLGKMRDAIAELMLARVRLTTALGELRHVRRGALEAPKKVRDPSLLEMVEKLEIVESRLRSEDFEFERLISVLEASSRDLRMVPIQTLFESYPQALRSLSKELEREVTLELEQEEVEVDRVVLEAISEPLMHLVRNAVDHGIEPPDVRVGLGKSPTGTISMAARVRGQNLQISIQDDGAGVSADTVAKRALEGGFATEEELASMEPSEVLRLIFLPKFTTRKTATKLSGRGLGLDIVFHRVERLGGSVDVVSQRGVGTTFTLVVPLSAAISTMVLMTVGDGSYALPGNAVLTILDAKHHPVVWKAGSASLVYQGRETPVVDLKELLDESPEAQPQEGLERILIMEDRGLLVALTGSFDHVEREAVVKAASQFLPPRSLVRAVVPNPDGSLALVIKPTDITAFARGLIQLQEPTGHDLKIRHVLVVDDSPIVRELVAQGLVSRGLKVTQAGDGLEALEALSLYATIGLVVTDIEMPRMDGLGLIRSIREKNLEHPTIVVVSMRGSEVERRRAFEAGANAYLVKTDLSQRNLWNLLSRYLT